MNATWRRSGPDGGFALLACAGFFALLTGVVEVAVKLVRHAVLGQLTWISRDAVWMTPLGYLLFFLVPALLLVVIPFIIRRPIGQRWGVTVFASLAVFGWLLPFNQLARWASAPLALGIGIRLAALAGRAPVAWFRAFRVGAAALGLLVMVAGAGTRMWSATAERRALASLVPRDSSSPSILLIVLDTVRRASLGLYGYVRPTTPELDRWAHGSTVFDRAIAPSSWTLPSHASLFTGRLGGEVGGDFTHRISSEPLVLAEELRTHGFVTGGFVANLLYTSYESGLARGFVHYDDYPVSLRLILMHASFGRTGLLTRMMEDPSPRGIARAVRGFNLGPSRQPADVYRPASDISDAFLAWQAGIGGRPYFAFLNYFDAHWPRSPAGWEPAFAGENRVRQDNYDIAIAWLDHEVGRVLDSLARRGVLDQTIVVVTSDHGELFGEHDLRGHANSLYLPVLAVPLLIRFPGAVPEGRRIGDLVTLRETAATLLDLAGVHRLDGIPGRSLARYWQGSPAPADVIADLVRSHERDSTLPNAKGPMVSRLDDSLHYIRDGRGREELYAYRTDSLELHNLAAQPGHQADLQRMRSGLVLPAAEAPRH